MKIRETVENDHISRCYQLCGAVYRFFIPKEDVVLFLLCLKSSVITGTYAALLLLVGWYASCD